MDTIYVFFADGFEETEAVTPVDILRRAGAQVKMVSVYPQRKTVKGSHGIEIVCDMTISESHAFADTCVMILPGGGLGVENLKKCAALSALLTEADKKGVMLAAICAAPTVLSDLGILRDKSATCYPSMTGELECADIRGEAVVIDKNIITSRGAGTAADFGFVITAEISGDKKAEDIRRAMCYPPSAPIYRVK
ncbi:MAG: DJ-1 family glyoxalase III [Oscillospiraceae bacterium]|nr:DJ-1 family glyoxalase III [Oscillospiraceae bacterium]